MHFDPFYPDPKNVLLKYTFSTGGFQVSENASEALCNVCPSETESLCLAARRGENPKVLWGSGEERTLVWSEQRQMIILRP